MSKSDGIITALRAGIDPDTKQLHITESEAKQAIQQLIDNEVAQAQKEAKNELLDDVEAELLSSTIYDLPDRLAKLREELGL